MDFDGSVYPDLEHLPKMKTDAERGEYVARICGAWDYGVLPNDATFRLLSTWRDVFEKYPITDSPAYQAFRKIFGWPAGEGRIFRAKYQIIDAREGRTDPCDRMI